LLLNRYSINGRRPADTHLGLGAATDSPRGEGGGRWKAVDETFNARRSG